MKLVIIESPYAGDVEANIEYARRCLRHSIYQGEVPFAPHLLYTQPGVLDDNDIWERDHGILMGLAWSKVAHLAVFYTDRGWSQGMLAAQEFYDRNNFPYEERTIA